MQEEKLRLRALRVGALPILDQFIARMGLADELTLALKNAGYAEALLALVKNILVDRNALYAVGEWTALYDAGLVAQAKIGDDKLGRALDRLFATDRATLQTRIVLAVMKRSLSLAHSFCSVDGSPTLPSNTSIATGQP